MEDDSEFQQHINREGHDATHNPEVFKQEGYIPFKVGDETFQTYYKLAGDLKSGKIPLVYVHGGPGYSALASYPHGDLATLYYIPVILYDQIGGGKSTHLPHKPKEFWTIDLFCDELEQLLEHFGIEDNYSLLGHSWGGLLSGYFIQKSIFSGLRSLILLGVPASIPLVNQSFDSIVENFPERPKIAYFKNNNGEEYDKADFEAAHMLIIKRHTCQLDPFPFEIPEALRVVQEDPTVFNAMLGMDHKGLLKDFSLIEELHKITVPTLIISGKYDAIQDFTMQPFFIGIPRVKKVQFLHSSHMPFFEEREKYMKIVGEFLLNVRK